MDFSEHKKKHTIFNQSMKETISNAAKSTDSLNKYAKESRTVYKEVFFQISVLCVGVISLSITYVGFISSKTSGVIGFRWLLFFSWGFLSAAVICGLLRNYIYQNYGHWQLSFKRGESLLELEKIKLELVKNYPSSVVNIKNEEDQKIHESLINKNIQTYTEAIEKLKRKEGNSGKFWKISENTALFGMGIGVILIVIYAALTLP